MYGDLTLLGVIHTSQLIRNLAYLISLINNWYAKFVD